MLGNYQSDVSEWISAMSTKQKHGGTKGLFALVNQASKGALEGTSLCNIASAALALRHLLKVIIQIYLTDNSTLIHTVAPSSCCGGTSAHWFAQGYFK